METGDSYPEIITSDGTESRLADTKRCLRWTREIRIDDNYHAILDGASQKCDQKCMRVAPDRKPALPNDHEVQ